MTYLPPHIPQAVLFAVCSGRYAGFLLEGVLKVALAGKAQVAADFSERLIRILQQRFCLPQADLHHVGTNPSAQLRPEVLE